mmetsp:Transcript_14362/g.37787  ORF Transcript_14362/g.37787 Transcript_14362/m.37787 type:complete len:203 (-) Transcript_14362:212-820(-)
MVQRLDPRFLLLSAERSTDQRLRVAVEVDEDGEVERAGEGVRLVLFGHNLRVGKREDRLRGRRQRGVIQQLVVVLRALQLRFDLEVAAVERFRPRGVIHGAQLRLLRFEARRERSLGQDASVAVALRVPDLHRVDVNHNVAHMQIGTRVVVVEFITIYSSLPRSLDLVGGVVPVRDPHGPTGELVEPVSVPDGGGVQPATKH